jgi:hypothetical protein
MKIWHDNSGCGDGASWYLKYIIVYDLQTKEKFYAFCENWLATEKGDGKIERNLNFVTEKEFKKLKRLNERLIDKCSDLHLWHSVFSKPIGSLFTRLNRVTCCFLSLYLSIFLITIYYTSINSGQSSISINFAFISLTQEQVT